MLHLTTNMRVSGGVRDSEFVAWINSLPFDESMTPLATMSSYIDRQPDLQALIKKLYPPRTLAAAVRNFEVLTGTALLTTKNATVPKVNKAVHQLMPGVKRTYLSRDTAVLTENPDEDAYMPVEFLNALEPNGMQPYKLSLKLGSSIIMIRNSNPAIGLCNRTRMVVGQMSNHSIKARILGGQWHNKEGLFSKSTSTQKRKNHLISLEISVLNQVMLCHDYK